MSFTNLGLVPILAGLAALAAGLYLLQRLRVRHRPIEVVTTLFWKEALEEARARVLVRRFRHPLAYAFLLLIAALLWTGFAEPRAGGGDERECFVLLDGSAGMQAEGRWQATLDALEERVRDLPRDRRHVIFCGAAPRALLLPGEHDLLLSLRLADLQPEACAASVELELRRIALRTGSGEKTLVVLAGAAPVSRRTLELLPESTGVERIGVPTPLQDNAGITALGSSDAASGDFEKLDVLVDVSGPGAAGRGLQLSLGGESLAAQAEREEVPGGVRYVLRDLPASGALLAVQLAGRDALAADDRCLLRLPERRALRVVLSPELPAPLRSVLEADPAVHLVSEGADIAVRRAGDGLGGAVPALEFVPESSQQQAFLFTHDPARDPETVLREGFEELGLDQVDAMELARRGGRVIALGAAPGPRRSVSVWESLLGSEFDFVQSRAFPLFVARSLRWLAGIEDQPARVAVGQPLATRSEVFRDAAGRQLDPVGVPFTPPLEGEYTAADGAAWTAALQDPATSVPPAGGADAEAPSTGPAPGLLDLPTLLVGAVLALLCTEWFLFRTGRIP